MTIEENHKLSETIKNSPWLLIDKPVQVEISIGGYSEWVIMKVLKVKYHRNLWGDLIPHLIVQKTKQSRPMEISEWGLYSNVNYVYVD